MLRTEPRFPLTERMSTGTGTVRDDSARENSARPTDDELWEVSRRVNTCWKVLAKSTSINVKQNELDAIDVDYEERGVDEKCRQMLRVWKQQNGDDSSRARLIQGLVDIGKTDIAAEVFIGRTVPVPLDPVVVGIALFKSEKLAKKFDNVYRSWTAQCKKIQLPVPFFQQENNVLPLKQLFVELELQCTDGEKWTEEYEPIESTKIFDAVSRNNRILIEGSPGFGKTTLALKLLSDAADCSSYLWPKFYLVFAIALRYFKAESIEIELRDVLNTYDKSVRFDEGDATNLFTELREHVLLILDGYDELSSNRKEALQPLLSQNSFPLMTIIVTSRPGQFSFLQSSETAVESCDLLSCVKSNRDSNALWTSRIRIMGITPKNQQAFLEKYQLGDKLFKVPYKLVPELKSFLNVPLYLILIALMIKDGTIRDIKCKMDLFKKVVNYQVKRNLCRENIIVPAHDVKVDIFADGAAERTFSKYVDALCDFGPLALEMIKTSCLYVTRDTLRKTFENDAKIDEFLLLGFLGKNVSFHANAFKQNESYEIIHKSFLELFAAWHISRSGATLCVKEMTALMKRGITPRNNELLYYFVVGQCDDVGPLLEALKPWSSMYSTNRPPMLNLLEETWKNPICPGFKAFIPRYWSVHEKLPNRLRTSVHHSTFIDLYSRVRSNDVLEVLKWKVDCFARYPRHLVIDTLILEGRGVDRNEILKFTFPRVTCENLIYRLSDAECVDGMVRKIRQVTAANVFVNVEHETCVDVKSIIGTLIENALRVNMLSLKCTADGNDGRIFSVLSSLVRNNSVQRGVAFTGSVKETQAEIDGFIDAVGKSKSIVNFLLDSGGKQSTVNCCLFSNGYRKLWNEVHFGGNIRFSMVPESAQIRINTVGFLLRSELSNSVLFLNSVCGVTELHCDVELLIKCGNQYPEWSGFQTVKKLYVRLINNSFKVDNLAILEKFHALELISVDMLDIRKQTASKLECTSLVAILAGIPWVRLMRLESHHLDFLIIFTNHVDRCEKSTVKALTLWFIECEEVKMKTCFGIVSRLIRRGILNFVDVLRPRPVQEDLLDALVLDDLKFERKVEPLRCLNFFNKLDVSLEDSVTEYIRITRQM